MKTAYIFHDAFNDQFSDWYPWMKTELEKIGYVTLVPQFPTPGAQSYESWRAVMKNYLATFDQETLLIGHGVGGTFALRLAEELSQKIKGLIVVASYAEPIGHVGYDRINQTFVEHSFNWEKIKNNCYTIAVIAGENDPFVPVAITEHLAQNLGEQVITIPDGSHINRASGFVQAVALIDIIKQSLQSIDKSITIETGEDSENENSGPLIEKDPSLATKEPPSEPLETGGEKNIQEKPSLEKKPSDAIHTMYQDMSHLVHSNQGQVASSLLAEARTQEEIKKEVSPVSLKNILYLLGTLLVLGIGVGALGYVFYQYLPAQQQPMVSRPLAIIPAETYQVIDTTNNLLFEIQEKIAEIASKNIADETIHDIIFLEQEKRISFSALLEKLNIATFPSLLKEQFGQSQPIGRPLFMYGLTQMSGQEKNNRFIIVPFIAYDTLFMGLSDWEPTMVRDLGVFFGLSDEQIQKFFFETIFSNELIFNKPTRVYRDDTGNFIMGYFFLNQKTIVFIDDPELIPLIIRRYANREILN